MDSVVDWRSGLSRVLLVRKRRMIGLRTERGLIAYPPEKFTGWRDWNVLMFAYNLVMGTARVRISYPENYEYRWILDPIVEKYPELWTESPAGYYTLLLLTEETVFSNRLGPAARRTVERIAGYVERGAKAKMADVMSERKAGLNVADVDVARLFLVYGFYGCRRTRDCPTVYGKTTRSQLQKVSNLVVEEIVPVIFSEELVKQYGVSTGTLPVVYSDDNYSRVRSGPSPLFMTVIEQLVRSMASGSLDHDLTRIFKSVEPGARAETTVKGNTVRLKLYVPGTGGDPVIVRFTVGELLRRVNRLLQDTLVERRSYSSLFEALRISPSYTENLISDSKHGKSDAILLAGDHAVFFPSWPETGEAQKITSLDRLVELLSEKIGTTGTMKFLYVNREKILSQAPRLGGVGRTMPDCFPCEEKLMDITRPDGKRAIIGRYKDYYILIEDVFVNVGKTVYSVLPHDFKTALKVLEHFGHDEDKRALEEANMIIKETIDGLGIEHMWAYTEDFKHTSYTTASGSVMVILMESGNVEDKVGPLLREAGPATGRLAVLEHALRIHGWKPENRGKTRAYRKGNVHIVLGGRR